MIILSALLLAVVISIDTLAAGFSYGTSNTKVPIRHLIVIDIIGSSLLGMALFIGFYIGNYINSSATIIISVVILVLMGGYKLVAYFRKTGKEITKPHRKIGWTETIILALILALDGVAVGFGASIHNTSIIFCISVIAFSLVTDFTFFIFGVNLGKKLTKKTRLDLSWLSGAVLIILGIIKLF
jgi:putative Mn2+ efflux pump MntP